MPPRTSQRKRAVPALVKVEDKTVEKPAPKKLPASKKRKATEETEVEERHECDSHDEDVKEEEPTPKKRKTKKDNVNDMAPLAARTAVSSLKKAMYVGAHVSGAGGRQNHPQWHCERQLAHLVLNTWLHQGRRDQKKHHFTTTLLLSHMHN